MAVSIFAATLLGAGSAFAQNRTINGKVVDTGGEPVIGAAVTVVGNTRIGAATDLTGAVFPAEIIHHHPCRFETGERFTKFPKNFSDSAKSVTFEVEPESNRHP